MKKLIIFTIFLLFTSYSFSDTIKYREKKLFRDYKDRVVTDVEFLGISKQGVHYQYSIKYLGNVSKTINCDDVYEILDNDKNDISYSCSEFTYEPMNEEKVILEAQTNLGEKRGRVGGFFIAIGAGLLIDNVDNKSTNIKKRKSTLKTAYGFIALGGILLSAGI